MKFLSIEDLYASAWDNAIEQTAEYVNKFGFNYTLADWRVLEPFAIVNDLAFDENGFILDETVEGCSSINAATKGRSSREHMDRGEELFKQYGPYYDTSRLSSDDADSYEMYHNWAFLQHCIKYEDKPANYHISYLYDYGDDTNSDDMYFREFDEASKVFNREKNAFLSNYNECIKHPDLGSLSGYVRFIDDKTGEVIDEIER